MLKNGKESIEILAKGLWADDLPVLAGLIIILPLPRTPTP